MLFLYERRTDRVVFVLTTEYRELNAITYKDSYPLYDTGSMNGVTYGSQR